MSSESLADILETIIFISQEPVSLERMKAVLQGYPAEDVERGLNELIQRYASGERGIQLIEAGGGYLFSTKAEHDPWVRKFLQIDRKNKLSSAALETLSIIAYNQPITQSEISAVRGVDSTYILKTLLQRKLIKITGRKKAPGKPLIYRTSEKFLTYFGLNDLDDLPTEEEIAKILEEEKTTVQPET